jgi:DNA-binding IclR family transcriptional regulator
MDDHTVIGRSLSVVAVVESADPDPASLASITRASSIPKPTVRRIADDLSRRGVLAKGPGGYRLGAEVEEFSRRLTARRRDLDQVRPLLLDLYATVGNGVWIATDRDGQVTFDDMLLSREATRAQGGRSPDADDRAILATALAPLALPHHPERVDRMFGAAPPRLTPYSPTSRRWFDDMVARVAGDGYAVEHEQVSLGWSCVAVPAWDGRHRRYLGAVMPVHRLRLRPMVRELRATAQSIADLTSSPGLV